MVPISTDERHGFGAVVPLSTRASPLVQGRAGGPVESSPQLVRHIGSGSTWFAEQLSPLITRSAATSSIWLRVFVSDGTSASMTRRGCQASCSRPANAVLSLSSHPQARLICRNGSCITFSWSIEYFFKNSIYIRQRGFVRPKFFLLGDEATTLADTKNVNTTQGTCQRLNTGEPHHTYSFTL